MALSRGPSTSKIVSSTEYACVPTALRALNLAGSESFAEGGSVTVGEAVVAWV